MTNLKCHEYKCKYNQCSHCIKDDISVSKDAFCNSFFPREEKTIAECNFEFSNEGPLSLKEDEHIVKCDKQSCLNNSSCCCEASYIRVDRHYNGPRCCNVRER